MLVHFSFFNYVEWQTKVRPTVFDAKNGMEQYSLSDGRGVQAYERQWVTQAGEGWFLPYVTSCRSRKTCSHCSDSEHKRLARASKAWCFRMTVRFLQACDDVVNDGLKSILRLKSPLKRISKFRSSSTWNSASPARGEGGNGRLKSALRSYIRLLLMNLSRTVVLIIILYQKTCVPDRWVLCCDSF